ncbi:MAG: hypothetical protein ACI82A_000478 [Candidatus Azotimanducaceae bacterium]|jgi:hypothetical protein
MKKTKWIVASVVVLGVLLLAAGAYNGQITNQRVIDELRSNPTSERANIVMLLTFPDGKSLPVNYLREGDRVFVGADGPWWRAFQDKGAAVSLLIKGEQLTGNAKVILDDIDYTHEIFARLRPNAPTWLPDWLNGKLVVITLSSSDS